MAIDVYWGSGSPFSWRVLLALEHKGLAYNSHLLHLGMQEHKAPHMLALNPRGRVPVLKDGDYVVFESLAVLYYLDRKYPAKPLFGDSPEEGAVIMRVCCEYQAYIEPYVTRITRALLNRQGDPGSDESTYAMHMIAGEARELSSRFLPVDANYPALERWLRRVEALPGYERTYPPHWRTVSS